MAKKIVFLLVMIFVLLIASVTVFAAETDFEASNVGFTEDKATLAVEETEKEVSVSGLEEKYGEVFFGEDSESNMEILPINYERDGSGEMRHTFFGQADYSDIENPYIMLMYIKVDGVYVPLMDIERKSNLTKIEYYLTTTVDLEYIGLNNVNEVRIIIFRKNDVDSLALDKNLQITNTEISFRRWNFIEKLNYGIQELFK
ncbi:MAG: hypothetical protein GX625_12470 [Clostridiaceae bacterium]|nr:hypothetical protein [Clostridiaceae bacterium]